MRIDIKEITSGSRDGETVWVCDIRYNVYSEATKPLRHVMPTQVQVTNNDQLPKNKTVYYSDSHFLVLSKSGKPLKSKVIAPFGNTGYREHTGTGYRAHTGTPLNVFTTAAECKAHYKKQCDEIVELLKSRQVEANKFFNNEMKRISEFKVRNT